MTPPQKLRWVNVHLNEQKAVFVKDNVKTRKRREVPLSKDVLAILKIMAKNANFNDFTFINHHSSLSKKRKKNSKMNWPLIVEVVVKHKMHHK